MFLLLCLSAFAQKDNRINALPENATLEETQAWLIRAIDQNSKYSVKVTQSVSELGRPRSEQSGYSDIKITGIKFQGCQISYTIEKVSTVSASKIQTQSSSHPATREDVKVMFDLKDMDLSEISIKEVETTSTMSVINLRTLDYKRVVKLKGDKETGNITVSVASIVIGTNIVEQVKEAFAHAVTLCQAGK